MKRKMKIYSPLLMIFMLALAGCVKEDMSDCVTDYSFTVRAYAQSGAELSQNEVSDVSLFVFNSSLRFVERIDTQLGQRVTISATGGDLHIVGWGNLGGGLQNYTHPTVGMHEDDCFVGLSAYTRASDVNSPGDLFRGGVTLTQADQSGNKVLPMYREVGSMAITIRDLKAFGGYADNDYWVSVGTTCASIDFNGNLAGSNDAFYKPLGAFAASGTAPQYNVAAFNMLPESTNLHIDIYHGTQLLLSVSQDSGGNAITVQKGQLTNVLIDLKTSLAVSLSITDWGQLEMWKEF